MQSAILHVDGDDFFAALARHHDPKLRKKPVIIGYLRSRGAVVAASYETRCSGISPGMTMQHAARLCPDAAMVQIDWDRVRIASDTLLRILNRYSPLVETMGADAAFMDYSGCHALFGPPQDFARRLQKEIGDRMHISASVGVSPDKAVSRVACRSAKLGMMQWVKPGDEVAFLAACPLGWLPGIDDALRIQFEYMGVRSIGDLARIPVEVMEHVLGATGRLLALRARGMENARVRGCRDTDALESSKEFADDAISPEQILVDIAGLCSHIGFRLRRSRLSVQTLQLSIHYIDGRIVSGQTLLTPPSHRDPDLFQAARNLFLRLYLRRVRVRRIDLCAKKTAYCPAELPLGDAVHRVKWNLALAAADAARSRFSEHAVQLGAALATRQSPV